MATEMSFTLTTQSGLRNVNLSLDGVTSVTVNWGDGNIETVTSNFPPHTYITAGTYTISLSNSNFTRLNNSNNSSDFSAQLSNFTYNIQISSLTNFRYAFNNVATNFTITLADASVTNNVLNMGYMFEYASAFNQPLNFNTSSVNNMEYMFAGASSFNSTLTFNTSSVGNMSFMFQDATSFNKPVNFNTSAVRELDGMFQRARAFNHTINFDGSNLIRVDNMFDGASAFNSPVTLSNIVNLASIGYLFYNASAFNNTINIDTSNVTNMEGMFYGATAFDQPISFNMGNVTNISDMFNSATSFNQPINFNATNLLRANSTFYGARAFNSSVTLSNSTSLNNTAGMFGYAISFNQPITFNTSSVSSWSSMFQGATSFNQNIGSLNISRLSNAQFIVSSGGAFTSNNYNNLLIGWAYQAPAILNGAQLDVGSITYTSSEAVIARNTLTSTYGWAIVDGGYVAPPYPCFKEGTKILTNKGYITVQELKKGDLVKTLKNDFKPIDMIGKREINHIASNERIKDQLYVYSKDSIADVMEPLVITGCHSVLVDKFASEEQKEKTIEVNGDTFVTDKKYRLPACVDERASVYKVPGTYTIYHFALENSDYYMNYGVYANGLLVETCSKRYLKELSGMTLIK